MDITYSARFDATPDRVVAMMSDPKWWEDVYRRAGATTSNPSVNDGVVGLDAAMPAPSQVRKFVGTSLRMHQAMTWGAASSDGSREGELTIVPEGMPARAEGHAHVRPDGSGTKVDYDGSFTVSIPLVGRKLEQTATPYVTRAFTLQQEAGDEWLAR